VILEKNEPKALRKVIMLCMGKYQALIESIAGPGGGDFFKPTSKAQLDKLRKLGFPESVIQFYECYEPQGCVEGGQIRLSSIDGIIEENTMAVPGIYVQPLGYLVFASTEYGDAYCFNLNRLNQEGEPTIVLMPHDSLRKDASPEVVASQAKPIAPSLLNFFEQFSEGKLDTTPIYSWMGR
jgi:SMI1 / KNR4 family (SUKH-1)